MARRVHIWRSGRRRPTGVVGKLFASVFFVIFAGMGLLFCGLLGYTVAETLDTWSWQATPCRIVASDVHVEPDADVDNPYRVRVNFEYEHGGRSYRGRTHRLDYHGHSDYSQAQAVASRYRAGEQATCYVNPDDAAQAYLQAGDVWIALALPLPLIFVVIGLGGLWWTWFGRGAKVDSSISDRAANVDDEKPRGRGRLAVAGFFFIFFAAGVAGTYFMLLRPALQILDAQSWVATPVVVERSALRHHESDDGTSYSVDILYRYEVDGVTYRSSRYDFVPGSSSDYSGQQAIVQAHPVGAQAMAYVNPDDPTRAVIDRDWTTGLWAGAIPLVFALVGLVGMLAAWLYRGEQTDAKQPWLPTAAIDDESDDPYRSAAEMSGREADGPVTLRPAQHRWIGLAFLTFFASIWNGIVWFVAAQLYTEAEIELFPALFLVPFMLIGVGLVALVVYQLLALFNPKAELTLSRAAIPLGESASLEWKLTGNAGRLDNFAITLEGVEEATYRRGTDTVTKRETFYKHPVTELHDRGAIIAGSGRAELTVPADTMHSFKANNNKIVWRLACHGDIKRWPDVNEKFDIVVLPRQT